MKKMLSVFLGILTGFVALTAIGGGIAILVELDKFPIEWLDGTPFKSFNIPAILLIVFVGGSTAMATINITLGKKNALRYSIVSGFLLTGFILVEILILKQVPPGPTPIEIFYLLTGIIISGLAFYLLKNRI
ncbi:MAG: hypothetical protein A2W99_02510 [Bacteroidetes bacterium GWF2_33_16]|nr:MAG: hypothetical protein A2X00_15645 [Bacteroidetes bacterium GWE2_32_14]OFY07133.1 MAG: hypothetical protein A2W99_02510 [Bacteroidetes bacterium GWF2_33_16]